MSKTTSQAVQKFQCNLDANKVRLVSYMYVKIWTISCSWWYVENLLANKI